MYDLAGAFGPNAERSAESLARTIRTVADADVVVVSETVADGIDRRRRPPTRPTPAGGDGRRRRARQRRADHLLRVESVRLRRRGALDGSRDFIAAVLSAADVDRIIETDLTPLIASCDLDSALLVGMSRIATAVLSQRRWPPWTAAARAARRSTPVRRYPTRSTAWRSTTRPASSRRTRSRRREDDRRDRGPDRRPGRRSTARSSRTAGRPSEADSDARALMDQWGVGRKGFDDGLVILFDMYPGLSTAR